MSFIRPGAFESGRFNRDMKGLQAMRAGGRGQGGIFYGARHERRSILPLPGVNFPPFGFDISGGNIPKYFQISCDYFCL
ncbi:hypothetical protein [Burkholderia territorii]|uniref:hypothetical protein n=1 Tax=Burkholderia territorii TaxID=1503055 RepID=UPI0018C6258E|nr:hypothetical protein [Burkholderia territorii]